MRVMSGVGLLILGFIAVLMGCSPEAPAEPVLLASGFHFPEGPSLDADGNLYVVNLSNTIINKITPDGAVSDVIDAGGRNNGAIFDAYGNLYIACTGRRAVLKYDKAGDLSIVTATSNGDSLLGPNDFAWDNKGRLYFTDPQGSGRDNPVGGVHYIDIDGTTKKFAGGLAFPNGLVFSPDKKQLFVGETNLFRIWRYEIHPDGSAGGRELFVQFEEGVLVDGMKADVDGNIWAAMYTESELWCFSPSGERMEALPVPGKNPTNLIFGGTDMRTAYVTVHDGDNGKVFVYRMPRAGIPVIPDKRN